MNHLAIFDELFRSFDVKSFRRRSEKLNRLEGNESYANYERSTGWCRRQLEKAGLKDVRRYSLQVDGKTSYFDCIMPQAWDTIGRSTLTIVDDRLPEADRVLADTDEQPLAISIWSAPTPEGGVTAEVVDASALDPEKPEVAGKIVFCDSEFGRGCSKYAEAGALGVVSCYAPSGEECDDGVRWMNGTGNIGWYHAAGDKRIFYFLITPRRGRMLKKLIAEAEKPLLLHAVSATKIYDGKVFTVTGRIPGKSSREVALVAHLYEPFVPDDAAGAGAIIELCRAMVSGIKSGRLPKPEKSIRVILSMELYGMAEYFARPEAAKILWAESFDSICHIGYRKHGYPQEFRLSPVSNPAAGDLLLRELLHSKLPEIVFKEYYGNLSDDTFTGDPMIGVPMNWVFSGAPRNIHHNSSPIFMEADWELGRDMACLMGAGALTLAAADDKKIRKLAAMLSTSATAEFAATTARTIAAVKAGELAASVAREGLKCSAAYQRGRLLSLNRFSDGAVKKSYVESLFDKPLKTALRAITPEAKRVLTPAEQVAAGMKIRRLVPGVIMSQARIPRFERRHLHPYADFDLVLSLSDNRRTLLEAVRIVDFISGHTTTEAELAGLVADMEFLEKYGYLEIHRG